MCARIHFYLEAFASLKACPHEPLLLLTVLDLVGTRQINRNFFDLSPALEKQYEVYRASLSAVTSSSPAIPFCTLVDTGFWHLVPRRHVPWPDSKPATLDKLRTVCLGAKVDDDLYPLLVMETSRERLRSVLLETYFEQEERSAIRAVALSPFQDYH